MEALLVLLVRGLFALLQALPLRVLARLGRAGGALAYVLDARHRRVAWRNLTAAFGRERSPAELRALARENFRRIGENFTCAIKTLALHGPAIDPHLEYVGGEKFRPRTADGRPQSHVVAVGHFGNFELCTHLARAAPGIQGATTYRALRQPGLNRLFQALRAQTGVRYFERRFEGEALKQAMREGFVGLGLLADQHAGDRGLPLPFLGRECSTSAAPAVFALRYGCPLYTAICYRIGLARWRLEVGDEIPTHAGGRPRPVAEIMLDVNRAFEVAVRRDPANWFWVHNRWKPVKRAARLRPTPAPTPPPEAGPASTEAPSAPSAASG